MLEYEDALHQLLHSLQPLSDAHPVPLAQAAGRVLAADLCARYDAPAFDNSAMDGYAVADAQGVRTQFGLESARLAAGDAPGPALPEARAVRIFTGAPLPAGATAVVPQEDAQVRDGVLHIAAAAQPGAHIRRRAEELCAGAELLHAGQWLSPAALALAASQGHASVPVLRRPSVVVFSSGDELREPGQSLQAGQICDANRHHLLAWLHIMGMHASDGGILPDQRQATREALHQAAQRADVVLTSGGVSAGGEDHIKAALQDIGQLDVWKIAIKPGKPFAWGRALDASVFMLPGNPAAAFVTFHMLVAPALRRLQGLAQPQPVVLRARSTFAAHTAARREFIRVTLHTSSQALQAQRLPGQGSAMLSACVQAHALAAVPAHTQLQPGHWLDVYPLPVQR